VLLGSKSKSKPFEQNTTRLYTMSGNAAYMVAFPASFRAESSDRLADSAIETMIVRRRGKIHRLENVIGPLGHTAGS